MERALSLPELLEGIFLYLDMTTLLVSIQRVNKTWNTAIAESPALQQKLFFRPISADEVSAYREHVINGSEQDFGSGFHMPPTSSNLVFSPLLVKKFGSCFFDFGPTYGFNRRAESFYTLAWTPNHPKTICVPDYGYGGHLRYEYKVEGGRNLVNQASIRANKYRSRFTTREATWRRMLVSQPPPPSIGHLDWEYEGWESNLEVIQKAFHRPEAAGGVRMGQLYDLVQNRVGHHDTHSAYFRVLWEQPREPFRSRRLREQIKQVFCQTTLLVQIGAEDDWQRQRDPPDIDEFDSNFRCEGFSIFDAAAEKLGPSRLDDSRNPMLTVLSSEYLPSPPPREFLET